MIESTIYALLAGRAYFETRSDINRFPVPQGWVEFNHRALDSGFEAITFTNGTEIVISLSGTDFTDFTGDWTEANLPLAFGFSSDQLREAALYYVQVKEANRTEANPNPTISFTGHSLGGGLAALMGVFFDEKAVTFDQAPFANAATLSIREDLIDYLNGQGYTDTELTDLVPELVSFNPYNPSPGREANVTGYYVEGEALAVVQANSSFEILGTQTMLAQTSIDVSSINLHSQALLTAFLENDAFRAIGFKLPEFLKMVFDDALYARNTTADNTKFVNLLEHLIRHQAGVTGSFAADAMLDRFTADLQKVAQDGGFTLTNTRITNTLVAFAMQFYYESAKATDAGKALFSTDGLTGGIRFDRTDVAGSLGDAKGWQLYFQNYLAEGLTLEEHRIVLKLLPAATDWFVQAGAISMSATAEDHEAFMLGGIGDDWMLGGSQADLLIGNAGDDHLGGGAGGDTLIGGAGFDTYIVNSGDGFDTVLDSDGQGVIKIANIEAKGSATADLDPKKWIHTPNTDTWVDQQNGIAYTKSVVNGETQLLIHKGDSNVVVNGWSDGELGIVLGAGSPPDTTTPAATLVGDFKKAIDDHATPDTGDDTYVMTDGNYTADGDEANALDLISGTAGNDVIDGKGGDDSLSGMAGDDTIEGGAGSDFIQGGLGQDTINGGAGDDIIYGSSDMAINKPTSVDFTKPVNDYPYALATGFNWTAGSYDTLANGVPSSYSDAPRNRLDSDQGNLIDSGAGDDFIAAGAGADYVHGGAGRDWIWGMDQDDVLFGDSDNDWIYGDGNQPSVVDSVVWASPENHGNDIIDGGDGDDYLFGQGKDDIILGGQGNDRVWGDDLTAAELDPAYHGNDYLDGGAGDDQIVGGGKDDMLIGGDGNDTLWGDDDATNLPEQYQGNDILMGGAGGDQLYGGAGNDILEGGTGNDQLYGGAGDDTYLNVEASDVIGDL
ncbi:MAG TPA: hypothetical protein VEP67_03470, partial [Thiobacillaceae bacterium]|nr:hypothetical protein [Thiobacillaceae bacterium]